MNSEQNNNEFFEMDPEIQDAPGFWEATKDFFIRLGRALVGSPDNDLCISEVEKKQILIRGAYICMFYLLGFLFETISLPFGAYAIVSALIGSVFTIGIGEGVILRLQFC